MSKVVKGALFGAAIYFSAGLVAPLLPNALMTGAFLSGFFGAATSLATGAFISGVSAQLAGRGRGARPETSVEYAGTVEARRILYGETVVSGPHLLPPA